MSGQGAQVRALGIGGEQAASEQRVGVVVLGMHRSGTSAFARLISMTGAQLPATLMPPGTGNTDGHWESRPIAEYNERVLGEFGSAWHDWMPLQPSKVPLARRSQIKAELAELVRDEYGKRSLILVKDPRISRLGSLFFDGLEEAGFDCGCVITLRSPLEVADSLAARNGFPRGESVLLWLRYMLDAELSTRGRQRIFLSFDRLFSEGPRVLEDISAKLKISWPHAPADITRQAEQFLRREHKHHNYSAEDVIHDPMLRGLISDAYSAFLVLEVNPSAVAALATLDQVREHFDAAGPMIARLLSESEERRKAVAGWAEATAQQAEAQRASFEAEARQRAAHVSGLEARISALTLEVEEAREREREALEAVKAAQSEAQDLADHAKKLHAREAELTASLNEWEAHHASALAARDADFAANRARSERALEEANAQRVRQVADIRSFYQTEIGALRERHAQAIARLHEEHENSTETLRAELDRLQQRSEQLQQQLQDQRPEPKSAAAAFLASQPVADNSDLWREQIAQLQSQLAAAEARVDQVGREIATARRERAAYERQIAQLQAEAATYGARLGRLLTRARKRIAPSSSWQARMMGSVLKAGERIYRFGFASWLSSVQPVRALPAEPGPKPTGRVSRQATPIEYGNWIKTNEPTDDVLEKQRQNRALALSGPLISVILPVYKVPSGVLRAAVESLQRQTYPNWEVCIAYADIDNDENWRLLETMKRADDRIQAIRLKENAGISGNSNAAFALAKGSYIALLDHDDELTEWALYDMAAAISENPSADFLYSDKDCIDEPGKMRLNALFKPKWSPEMLFSVNYLTHLNVMRRSLVAEIGGWRPEMDGAQDWDLFFRVAERSREVVRVPGVHYHWRILPTSTSTGIDAKPYAAIAQLRTVQDRVLRLGMPATVTADPESGFRLHWDQPKTPSVDLVVYGADGASSVLDAALSEYPAWIKSISVVGRHHARDDVQSPPNGPALSFFASDRSEPDTEQILRAAASGSAPNIVFVDAKLTSLSQSWVEQLAGWLDGGREQGFIGSLLLTDSNEVIEAGRIVGASATSAPLFCGSPLYQWGWFGGPLWFRNVSAVGPHLAAVKRHAWQGDDAADASSRWTDVFVSRCVQMRALGLRGLVNPHVRAVRARRPEDGQHFWDDTFREDPYFHPAFTSVSPLRLAGN